MNHATDPGISNWTMLRNLLTRQSHIRSALPALLSLMAVFVTFNVTEPYFYKLFIDAVESVLSGGEPISE